MLSFEQHAFILGRIILENIMLAQEMVHSLNWKSQAGTVMIKIDMTKVYDRVN